MEVGDFKKCQKLRDVIYGLPLTSNSQVDSNPPEGNNTVLLLDAKEVHDHQDDGDQDVDE